MSTRLALPVRRNCITQEVRIADQRTLYISVHDDGPPPEVFLRVKGTDCSSELIGSHDVIAHLMSLALQYLRLRRWAISQLASILNRIAPCLGISGLNASRTGWGSITRSIFPDTYNLGQTHSSTNKEIDHHAEYT